MCVHVEVRGQLVGELVPSCHHVRSGDQMQVVRLDSKDLSSLNSIVTFCLYFYFERSLTDPEACCFHWHVNPCDLLPPHPLWVHMPPHPGLLFTLFLESWTQVFMFSQVTTLKTFQWPTVDQRIKSTFVWTPWPPRFTCSYSIRWLN